MPQEPEAPQKRTYASEPQTRWQENHGSLLLAFVGLVVMVGACILFYRQHRFVPVRFPESEMIEPPASPEDDPVEATEVVLVNVTGAANDIGSVKIAVYDSAKNFNRPEAALASSKTPVVDGVAEWKLPIAGFPAKIAIAAFHDENGDGELNRNRLGIPTERYGFSRNARGLTGPPDFEEAAIELPAVGETVYLTIR